MRPGPTALAAVSGAVERALNRALAMDPAGRQALLPALDQPVRVALTAPVEFALTLSRHDDRVRATSQDDAPPALTLSGRPFGLLAFVFGDARALIDGRITVDGDADRARQLQQALTRLDPDWEGALAEHLGDLPAHFLGRRVRQALTWARQAAGAMTANVEEYLHEESRALPGRRELQAGFDDITALTDRVDRLRERIDTLASREGL